MKVYEVYIIYNFFSFFDEFSVSGENECKENNVGLLRNKEQLYY